MALEVGIVGLQSSGKSMLFAALTGARAHGEVGMAAIPDARLLQLAFRSGLLALLVRLLRGRRHFVFELLERYGASSPIGDASRSCYLAVKGVKLMSNSIYNGWRFEDVWLDK